MRYGCFSLLDCREDEGRQANCSKEVSSPVLEMMTNFITGAILMDNY